jgi:hypothetical protein
MELAYYNHNIPSGLPALSGKSRRDEIIIETSKLKPSETPKE